MPGADIGLRAEDPTIATALKALGYRDRAVRQEPLRRPRRVPADRARVRRVLRQPLPPQRRGGARAPRLPVGGGVPGLPQELRPARRHPRVGEPDADGGPAHRGHRSAHQGADEDHRRRGGPRGAALHDRGQGQRHAVLRVAEHHPHALPDPRQGRQPGQGRPLAVGVPRHDVSTTTSSSVRCSTTSTSNGLADNTIVMYSTDNGPHMNTWPDAGMTPFRNEKNSNWEGAYRVPAMVRWPGHIPAGQVLNGIVSHNDWFVTLLAAAGDTDVADRLKAGSGPRAAPRTRCTSTATTSSTTSPVRPTRARDSTSSTSPTTATSPRCATTTGSSSSSSSAARARWASGPSPSSSSGAPKIFNLRTDPYERADITSNTYFDWMLDHAWLVDPGRRRTSPRCSRPSPSSRRDRSRRASASTRCWRSSRPASPAREPSARGGRQRLAGRRCRVACSPWGPTTTTRRRRPPTGCAWTPSPSTRPRSPTSSSARSSRRRATAPWPSVRSSRRTIPTRRRRTWCPARWCSRRPAGPVDLRHISQWWTWTPGACWSSPEGPGSSVKRRPDHPVVHVAYEDALAYADWAGADLPDRGRVGVRRPRRPRGGDVHLG